MPIGAVEARQVDQQCVSSSFRGVAVGDEGARNCMSAEATGASATRLQRIVFDGCSQGALLKLLSCKQCLFTLCCSHLPVEACGFWAHSQANQAMQGSVQICASVTRTLGFRLDSQR